MSVARLISLRLHAISDVLLIVAAVVLPWALGFAGYNRPSLFVWGIAVVALTITLVSRYPLGIFRLLPMKAHSLLEYAVMPSFFIMPFYQFSDVPGLTVALPLLGALNLLTNLLTDYPDDTRPGPAKAKS